MGGDIVLCSDGSVREDDKCDVVDRISYADRVRVSKRMAYILRHNPSGYGLKADPHGWVPLDTFIEALRRDFPWITERHIEAIVKLDPKGRYEICCGRIRARYGHSFMVYVEPYPGPLPSILFHGTRMDNVIRIMNSGIKPMRRIHVHLTDNINDAIETGRRHGGVTVVLKIDVKCLVEKGLMPGRKGKSVYTVEWVPPECIRGVINV